MTEIQQKLAAKNFADKWENRGYEKGESQPFWLSLLQDVYGVNNVAEYIKFEQQVHIDNTAFIDGYIEKTRVMIEQKSIDKDLRKPIKQSDGTLLNAFQQAKRYIMELPVSKHPRWVITCNFKSFLIYDMENPSGEPEELLLKNLPEEFYRLAFLVDKENEYIKKETEISVKAGELVGRLYDLILKQYKNPEDVHTLKSLNMLCVRIVFCLYAEDAGIFGKHLMFHDYLKQYPAKDVRGKLIELFKILDTKIEDRDAYLNDDLAAFPYVNGGLFADEDIEIPNFNQEIMDLLLNEASIGFDWSEISPTIFGAVFESTLNPETRRSGGMHYTSIENIHKVINPLFLNELRAEFEKIKAISVIKNRNSKLDAFQSRLADLKFLDPACGSGNFLTETYLSLRKLENEIIALKNDNQILIGREDIIKVSIGQFYGIEINDFAVTVAKTALWIAESQMMKQTEDIIHTSLDFLPLKSYANIVEGNALKTDWNEVVSKYELNYIMGNPPFIGARIMNKEQKDDILNVFRETKSVGNLDYVSGWYVKAANYIDNTTIKCAFVSTNSITQGEQSAILWKPIMEKGIKIDFAWRTFKWNSEASEKAAVHCVIIGFSDKSVKTKKILFHNDQQYNLVENINAYLIDAPDIFVLSRKKPIANVPPIDFGNMPNDNGFLSDFSDEEKKQITNQYPNAEKMFKRFVGATEFLHNKTRWCLWLVGVSPSEIKEIPPVYEVVNNVRNIRNSSSREATRKLALTPYLFGEIRQPDDEYIIIPLHSSENRKYIPVGYMQKDVICSNANSLLPHANLYYFGVLMSNVHNAWVRAVCGRIKSDYRYSNTIVYNNFPWCSPTPEQKAKIEQTAKAILDARALYPDSSLADLYDEVTMPPELRKAHQQNDRAVMEAYGIFPKDEAFKSESACVALLMKMYIKITNKANRS